MMIVALMSPIKDEPYELEPKDGYEIALILDASESMKAQGWSDPSLARPCRRAGIGYDGEKIKIVIVNGSLADLQNACIKTGLVYNGKACAIALDAGGSFALVQDGKIVHNSDGRYMRNIIFW